MNNNFRLLNLCLLLGLFLGVLPTRLNANILEQLQAGFRFQELANAHKLSNLVIKDIAQDANGFIWVATRDGLNRFDGQESTVYRPSNSVNNYLNHFVVNSLLVDKFGLLWAGTENGLSIYNPKLDSFEVFERLLEKNSKLLDAEIIDIFEDSSGRLWIATVNKGVYLISADRLSIENIKFYQSVSSATAFYAHNFVESDNHQILAATDIGLFQFNSLSKMWAPLVLTTKQTNERFNYEVRTLFNYKHGEILAGTTKGLYRIDLKSGKYIPILPEQLAKKTITAIHPFDRNQILLGTHQSGLFLVNLDNQQVKQFESSPTEKFQLNNNQVISIFQSKEDLFWIGTTLGINILNKKTAQFGHIQHKKELPNCISGKTVYAVLPDSQDILWVASFGQGLNKIELNTGQCSKLTSINSSLEKVSLKSVVSLFEDETGDIWIGTYSNGVIRYRRNSQTFKTFNPELPNGSLKYVTAISGDHKGKIWIATQNSGFFEYDISSSSVANFTPSLQEAPEISVSAINDLKPDDFGNLWLATRSQGLWKFNTVSKKFSQFVANAANPKGIPAALYAVKIDRQGNLWLGSQGQGAIQFTPATGQIKNYTTENGLLNNVVMNIQQDSQGNMWFLTDGGISQLTQSNEIIRTFLEKDGLQADAFTTAGYFDRKSNQLWTGGINGINHFDPKIIAETKQSNKVVITGFELFYKPVMPSSEVRTTPLNQVIHETKKINLHYSQNVFAFSFSAMEFLSPKNIQYKFMLEGYDLDWNSVNAERRYANYTNIAPGKYIFKVKAANQYGVWNESATSIKINIAPPWWQTGLAYVTYILILISSIYILINFRTKSLVKRSRHLEKSVTQRTEELAQEKRKVEQLLSQKNEEFANISHEFRTPLTLILGPITHLLNSKNSQEEINRLNIIQRNGYRLSRMVDQLLNLETFRVKAITQKTPQATGKTIRLLTEAFADLAAEKNIQLNIGEIANINFEFTSDALEKIILNLLSNAIKYTKSGGSISIKSLRTNKNELRIEVKDTGIGIPKDKLESIFERYNRVLDENSEQITGAGIGLSLVKALVESHQGTIEIKSKPNLGTSISVYLPIIGEVEHTALMLHSDDEIIAMELMSLTSQAQTVVDVSPSSDDKTRDKNNTVLVIEDNQDMRAYIVDSIKDRYQVITAQNGEEGLILAISEIPDIIISDVMMPKMDGYKLTRELRKNQLTSHIPIILLTARGDRESRLKGWHEKADEYLTKPFDTEELIIRLNNLLEIRDILKRRFSETAFSFESTNSDSDSLSLSLSLQKHETNLNRLQQAFVLKLNQVLESIYIEAGLSVLEIAEHLAMSERQLFRKLKNTLDMTPADYLRRFRLEKAKILLEQGESVSFATFEVGFSTQSNFSKCFKAQFGLSPTDYKKSKSI
jgi:signal transduction histidine kinase/ligand-binding sensor domain-containing protein/DNA-binding response OmpR family regulator